MTYLAVSIFAECEDAFLPQLDCARSKGAEAVEIRADALMQPGVDSVLKMARAVRKAKLPVIVTCRDNKDLIMAYLDSELDDTQNKMLQEHLAQCPQC